mmetsp:Transcript_81406/g.264291  ORF Transcript_81406/g.264291 Transcript_81406/m.264291 type:complete len:205 (-) Transcript_81406:2546-3160(-)
MHHHAWSSLQFHFATPPRRYAHKSIDRLGGTKRRAICTQKVHCTGKSNCTIRRMSCIRPPCYQAARCVPEQPNINGTLVAVGKPASQGDGQEAIPLPYAKPSCGIAQLAESCSTSPIQNGARCPIKPSTSSMFARMRKEALSSKLQMRTSSLSATTRSLLATSGPKKSPSRISRTLRPPRATLHWPCSTTRNRWQPKATTLPRL